MRRFALSDLALGRPVTVGMALVAILLLGLIGLDRLPLAFLPTSDMPRIYIRANVARTTPEILEREVIRPLEEQVAGMRDLTRIQTGSGSWGVRMNLEFRSGTDVDARKLELRDRIERARPDLPDLVQRIELGSYTQVDDPVIELELASDLDLASDYYLIQERIIRPIERIDGVSRVELFGVQPHEIEIALDLEATERSGVAPGDVGTAVRDARQGRSLGLVRGADRDPGVRSPGAVAEAELFSSLPLPRTAAGLEGSAADRGFARVGEVADVSRHPQEDDQGRRMNGVPSINMEVFGTAGSSTVEVSRRVQETVANLSNDPVLAGIQVMVFEDQGAMVLQTLGDLRDTGLWGGLLGVFVLYVFLRRGRSTFAAALAIPLSVLAACAILFLRGDELNSIVLLGLVLGVGMLIDNSVVIVESIERQAARGRDALTAARLGARDVGLATIASTLSSVIVFLPLIVGDPADPMTTFLRPLGLTFAIALTCSLVMSQMAVPLLMGRLLKPKPKVVKHPILDGLAGGYAWLIARTLRFPRLATLLGLMLAASAALPASQVNYKFGEPDDKPDFLPVRLQLAGSRGKDAVEQHILVMEEALLPRKAELGIGNFSCRYRDWGGNCKIFPIDAFESEHDMEAFEETIQRALPEQAGLTYRLGERDFHWRENRDRKVVDFAIKGEDMGVLMELAEEVRNHLEQKLRKGDIAHPEEGGYDQITTPFSEGSKEINVVLEPTQLDRHGLSASDVAQAVTLAFQGLQLGRARGERGEIALRMSAKEIESDGGGLARLRDLRLETAAGSTIPLGSVARLERASSPHWVQRVDRQTEVRLQVKFFDEDARANKEIVDEAMASFQFPTGYHWGEGTQWRKHKEAGNEMLVNLGLCLMLVYAVMASLFESFLQPFAILVTCLLGCFGAPWAMWVTGSTVDTTALIGLFILIGIVVNNGIMLVDKVTQLRAAGTPRDEALALAGRQRLRPILMTATTTILGLVPMLIHHPTLAGVYYHTIAIIIAGGLATSTVVTLIFLPAAYCLIEDVALTARAGWRRILG